MNRRSVRRGLTLRLAAGLGVCLSLAGGSTPHDVSAAVEPTRQIVPAGGDVAVRATGERPVRVVLSDFFGRPIETDIAREGDEGDGLRIDPGETLDLGEIYPALSRGGTYLLRTVEVDGTPIGRAWVIGVRQDGRPGASARPLATAFHPLQYVHLDTSAGPLTMAFYYDAAPQTVETFLRLAGGGFYDGLTFHRVVPGAIVQGGDPFGDGTGGAGVRLPAEFSDLRHGFGTVSMARLSDPIERQGTLPRAEAADSASGQFFIALSRARTASLDRRYTLFARVIDGFDTLVALSNVPVADASAGRPAAPPVIRGVRVVDVVGEDGVYSRLFEPAPEPFESPGDASPDPSTYPAVTPSLVPAVSPAVAPAG